MRIVLVGCRRGGRRVCPDRGTSGISSTGLWSPTTTSREPSEPLRRSRTTPRRESLRRRPGGRLGRRLGRALVRDHQGTHVMNAVDPRFVMPIFIGAYAAGADYLDMAMSLSQRHAEAPYEQVGVKLGDEQFALRASGSRLAAGAGRHGCGAWAV